MRFSENKWLFGVVWGFPNKFLSIKLLAYIFFDRDAALNKKKELISVGVDEDSILIEDDFNRNYEVSVWGRGHI